MAQDKQTSVKILQTQIKRKTGRSLKFFLLGGVLSISCVFICFFIFYKMTNRIEANQVIEESKDSSFEHPLKEVHSLNATTPVNDDDLKDYFKHQPVQNKENKVQSNTPFDALYINNKPKVNEHSGNSIIEKLEKKRQQPNMAQKENVEIFVKPSLLNTLNIDNELEIPESDSKKIISLRAKDK
ncbi:hypothetical protein [Acinetobacter boissieri]|uniref:Uncharacterized protein n=1 Tax=Acinetobacter boissieri TaxID=1219383 RepID=A0A1G6IJA4_9GAMM|nr:hypothetical protein [Acinetobacter boissieri]SDC06578.1 hypothetical protein SAMN05421733_108156 [Acinetobacter boissieri]